MTTFRRFCCNDLLRIGPIHLASTEIERRFLDLYMQHIAIWPSNCHVADAPGGRITGYVMGYAAGVGEDCTGKMTVIAFHNMNRTDVRNKLSNLLVDSCYKIYNCYRMVYQVDCCDNVAIAACEEMGYTQHLLHSYTVEMIKPLRIASRPLKNDCQCDCMMLQQERTIAETLREKGAVRDLTLNIGIWKCKLVH